MNTSYFAMVDEQNGIERPITVFRRTKSADGQIDEAFSRNLRWEFSPLLYSAERGETMYDFTEISEDEANQIVERIRAEADRAE